MINLKIPNEKELKYAGILISAVFFIFAGIIYWRIEAKNASIAMAGLGAGIITVYYLIPASRMFIYFGWMKLVSPIGWLVSHLILAVTYYVILTPIGLLLRLLKYDPMERRFEPNKESYWKQYSTRKKAEQYFNQY